MVPHPPGSTLFPYTTLFRSVVTRNSGALHPRSHLRYSESGDGYSLVDGSVSEDVIRGLTVTADRKSTRLNSSHVEISYAVFCLKKKKNEPNKGYKYQVLKRK